MDLEKLTLVITKFIELIQNMFHAHLHNLTHLNPPLLLFFRNALHMRNNPHPPQQTDGRTDRRTDRRTYGMALTGMYPYEDFGVKIRPFGEECKTIIYKHEIVLLKLNSLPSEVYLDNRQGIPPNIQTYQNMSITMSAIKPT